VVLDALAGRPGVGTWVAAHERRLPARKLWIAFALPAEGRVVIDDGAVAAITARGRSLLPAGVVRTEGSFGADVAVEIVDQSGRVVAKGLTPLDAATIDRAAGHPSKALPEGHDEVVHRDDLVVMPGT
jgi:glutamate 5-kinase